MQIEMITFPFLFIDTCLFLNKIKALNFLPTVQGIINAISAEANVSVCVLSTDTPASSQSTANHWIRKIRELSDMLKISLQIYQIRQADIKWKPFFSALMYQASLITICSCATKHHLMLLFLFPLIFFHPLVSSFSSCTSWNHIPCFFHL